MTSIRKKVEDLINHDSAVQKDLARDVINTRALARHLQNKIEGEASLDAIISAIRRYSGTWKEESSKELLRNCKISMKNDIVDISLSNSPEVHKSLGKLPSLIDFSAGEILRLIAGVQAVKVIADRRNLEDILEKFSEKDILKPRGNLSELILTFPPEAEKAPGIISKVTTELSLDGINIIELMSSAPELILLVEKKDALRSYRILSNLTQF